MPNINLLEKLESFSSRAEEFFRQIQRATDISADDEFELDYLVDAVDRNLTKISAIVSRWNTNSNPGKKVKSSFKNHEDSESRPQEFCSVTLARTAGVKNNVSNGDMCLVIEHGVSDKIKEIDVKNTGEKDDIFQAANSVNEYLKSQLDVNFDAESDAETIPDDVDEYQKISPKVC